ncbi:MAG: L-arabinose isomerase [Planctomycetes bacterium]|nr:L-arabinose isomerase [Planctomycetota bacterium]
MIDYQQLELWFVTGSQHLYGAEALQEVADNSQALVKGLNEAGRIPIKLVFKPVLTGSDDIRNLCLAANAAKNCVGLVTWMHTFSPSKMWIAGLKVLAKPICHLHTQLHRDIPWASMDMDFMNLNQAAHGGREYGYMGARLQMRRKIVVGHWEQNRVQDQLATWTRAAVGWHDMQTLNVVRIGDNMRNVAVTEGDKVGAQIKMGFEVNGYGMSELECCIDDVSQSAINDLVNVYEESYVIDKDLVKGGSKRQNLLDAAQIEIALRAFLAERGADAFTNTFEDLAGMKQLPGIASQRLMADGIGFGAEGDWKTSAMVHCLKVMGQGLNGGCSFMEDYTYHLDENNMHVLGSHMLEVCPSIAAAKPSCEAHHLGIGGKDDPVRLVFDAQTGPAINISLISFGDRYRLLMNEVDVVEPLSPLPNLPVARAVWKPRPNLPTAAAAWIQSGGAHHTVFTQALSIECLEDFADMACLEPVIIDADTTMRQFMKEIRLSEMLA